MATVLNSREMDNITLQGAMKLVDEYITLRPGAERDRGWNRYSIRQCNLSQTLACIYERFVRADNPLTAELAAKFSAFTKSAEDDDERVTYVRELMEAHNKVALAPRLHEYMQERKVWNWVSHYVNYRNFQ